MARSTSSSAVTKALRQASRHDPNRLIIVQNPGENEETALARAVLRPSVQAAFTMKEYDKAIFESLELNALVAELSVQAAAATAGDLQRAEGMLVAQAHTLDAVFNNLARRAIIEEYLPQYETHLRLALKAQSQCRATLETLAAIKNPTVLFARQANIAAGPQQINNGIDQADASRARETEIEQSKLSGVRDELLSDAGTSALAGRADPQMATLGEVNRAQNKAR
jgi:hypothetical protein